MLVAFIHPPTHPPTVTDLLTHHILNQDFLGAGITHKTLRALLPQELTV